MEKWFVSFIKLNDCEKTNKNIYNSLFKIFPQKINEIKKIKCQNFFISKLKSHIESIKLFLCCDQQIGFIVENTFVFETNVDDTKKILSSANNSLFDLIALTYNFDEIFLDIQQKQSFFTPIKSGKFLSGYLIHKHFAEEFIKILEHICQEFQQDLNDLKEIECSEKERNNYIDQIATICTEIQWKFLNHYQIVAATPRLGKNETKNDFCFFSILSCEKYKCRRNVQDLSKIPFQYRYFVGDPNLSEPKEVGDVVYLPCGDYYEDLPTKSKLSFKWIKDNYSTIDYIFKTDDDIKFDFNNFLSVFVKVFKNNIAYGGHVQKVDSYFSNYHFGKCNDKKINCTQSFVRECKYCPGGGYFLKSEYLDRLVNEIEFCSIFEDVEIGWFLNQHCKIDPVTLEIYNHCCFWEN